jgi:hypothetical protein
MLMYVKVKVFPEKARYAGLVTIEALLADRLRHILEELLPIPRRGVYML